VKTQLVIFGVTGDLAGRKLLPALDSIIATGSYDDLSIVGVSRRQVDKSQLLAGHDALVDRTKIYSMDLSAAAEYQGLKQFLEAEHADQTLFYLSVPPGAAADIVDFLGQAGLNTPKYKILFEKPFGYDLVSAQDFIARTARYFSEAQLYRIDHYMGKEIAAEIIRIRQNAEKHHHHWNNQSVKAITVVATESIGIEGRAQFYEQTGALRDFIQGHLMQLLSLVLIQNPKPGDLPAQRLKALQSLLPVDPVKATRAQYESYQTEVQNPGSQTETFVAFMIESGDPAWAGVPIRLLTGKALREKRSYVSVEYIDGTEDVFDEALLTARDGRHLDAYERVLIEAVEGRKEIFTSGPEVVRSWELLAPLQRAWSMSSEPLPTYKSGSDITALHLS
jgi:glucose-6-phosphate 1-dehydrogenase